MVEQKSGRKKWGYRFYLHGRCFKKYVWHTKAEAAAAEREARVELKNNPPLPVTALGSIAAAYLVELAESGKSKWRIHGVSHSLENHILPHFGAATPVAAISSEDVEKLINVVKRKGLKPISTKQVLSDARACFNWAKRKKFLRDNPVSTADLSLIGSTKVIKPPLDLDAVERAAQSIENESDRGWFDVTRFTGMRKDETNRLQWSDINFESGMIHITGTKTEDSDAWLPLAPALLETLKPLYEKRKPGVPWVFPGRRGRSKDKKVYERKVMFETIMKKTGIKIRPKDLRDYFATVVSGKTDINTLMRLMRHTNLNTTTKYMRTLHDSMTAAVKHLGAVSGGGSSGNSAHKTAQNSTEAELAMLRRLLLKYGNLIGIPRDGAEEKNHDLAFSTSAAKAVLYTTINRRSFDGEKA